jgi:methylglutaconyl-CoA hydratase
MDTPVLSYIEDRIGFIILNRPEKRNALSPEMVQELIFAFAEMDQDPGVKVVILKAEGEVFCAGADLDYLKQMQDYSYEENLEDSNRLKELFTQIYEFPKVVIAQVQGHALAGGCGLVTVCDFAFASSEAKFGYTEVKIGFVPALVSVFLAEQIGLAVATELLLSGNLITASKAGELGLITAEIAFEDLEKKTRDFAQNLARDNSAFSMQETKRLLRSLGQESRHKALDRAAESNAKARSHGDCVKGLAAFLSKTKPEW